MISAFRPELIHPYLFHPFTNKYLRFSRSQRITLIPPNLHYKSSPTLTNFHSGNPLLSRVLVVFLHQKLRSPLPAIWQLRGSCLLHPKSFLSSQSCLKISFSLAATKTSKVSRTLEKVRGNNDGVILLCALRRSRSSHIWRLCRVSEGLSLDYG